MQLTTASTERETLRVEIEKQKKSLLDEFNKSKAIEIAQIQRDYEARIEVKNEQILAEQDRAFKEAKEKEVRDEMRVSQEAA